MFAPSSIYSEPSIKDKIKSLDVDDVIDFKIAELIFRDKGIEWLMT